MARVVRVETGPHDADLKEVLGGNAKNHSAGEEHGEHADVVENLDLGSSQAPQQAHQEACCEQEHHGSTDVDGVLIIRHKCVSRTAPARETTLRGLMVAGLHEFVARASSRAPQTPRSHPPRRRHGP